MAIAKKGSPNANDCFIVAPISTGKELVELYGGDQNHFSNVLKYLLVPAVREAGLNPIEPVMEGSDVIHAQIIRNLEESPHVLCDISSLNPNVMLELGIRTAGSAAAPLSTQARLQDYDLITCSDPGV